MRGIAVWSSGAELEQRADQHERLARGAQGAADEVRDHLAEDDDGEADQGVVEAALRTLDGAGAAAGGHPLVTGGQDEEGASGRGNWRARGDQLGEQVDGGGG